MMRLFPKLIFFLMFTALAWTSQTKPGDFIPKGYREVERYKGDLNGDGRDDLVLIIKRIDKRNIVTDFAGQKVDRNRRGIIILFKSRNGYRLAARNTDCFSSENEEGGIYFPPELWIEIKKGKLYIEYLHGRYGYWQYVFRYHHSHFELIGYDASINHGPVVEKFISINFLTKKKLIRINTNKNAQGGDERFIERWSCIKWGQLITLSEIKDFDKLDWKFQKLFYEDLVESVGKKKELDR
ncbi:hypothetical protein [Nitratifractor salsuginis]|nr:hypothetical protein [Nitratifractor salsuginis]